MESWLLLLRSVLSLIGWWLVRGDSSRDVGAVCGGKIMRFGLLQHATRFGMTTLNDELALNERGRRRQ